MKKNFIYHVTTEIAAQGIVVFHGQVAIFIDLCFTNKRKRDIDNYSPKWLLDALVACWVIEDDSKEFIPTAPDVMIIDSQIEEKMLVKIEEIV